MPWDHFAFIRLIRKCGLPPTERHMLHALASRSDSQTGETFASHGRLADDTGMHRSTVVRALGQLVEKGHVSIVERHGRTCTYMLHCATETSHGAIETSHSATCSRERHVAESDNNVAQCDRSVAESDSRCRRERHYRPSDRPKDRPNEATGGATPAQDSNGAAPAGHICEGCDETAVSAPGELCSGCVAAERPSGSQAGEPPAPPGRKLSFSKSDNGWVSACGRYRVWIQETIRHGNERDNEWAASCDGEIFPGTFPSRGSRKSWARFSSRSEAQDACREHSADQSKHPPAGFARPDPSPEIAERIRGHRIFNRLNADHLAETNAHHVETGGKRLEWVLAAIDSCAGDADSAEATPIEDGERWSEGHKAKMLGRYIRKASARDVPVDEGPSVSKPYVPPPGPAPDEVTIPQELQDLIAEIGGR